MSILFVSICSLLIPYYFLNIDDIGTKSSIYLFSFFERSKYISLMMSNYFSLGNILSYFNGYGIFLFFITLMIYVFLYGYKNKIIILMFISLSTITFTLFNLFLSNHTMVQSGARYMISTLPLVLLAGMYFKISRYITCLWIIGFTILTLFIIISPSSSSCISDFWRKLPTSLKLPEDTILLTDRGRYAYVLLEGRNYTLPLQSMNSSVKQIWIAGSSEFINSKLTLLKKADSIRVKNIHALSSYKKSGCLSALVSIDLEHKDNPR